MPMIAYDADKAVGATGTSAGGQPVRYVEPEQFYVALLGERMSATLVFLAAHNGGGLSPERLRQVDDALAAAYWDTYLGCLMPPVVLRALAAGAHSATGPQFVDLLEDLRADLFDARSLDEAFDLHAEARVHMLRAGAQRLLSDEQVAIGELLTDYLLLQRATAEDIRRAERERAAGETRSAVLDRLDKGAKLEFERVVGLVLQTKRVADLIPAALRPEIEAFARRRRQYYREGVLTVLAGG